MALITAYWGLDGIIVLTTLMIIVYLYMTRNFKYWKKRGISEIFPPTPFLGNFTECLLLRKAPAYFLKELYEQAKGLPYFGLYIFDKPFLLVRDRELVKNILIKDFNTFSDRYIMADPKDRLGCNNLFFMRNPTWKMLRMKLSPFFSSGKLKKMFELMLECGNNLDTYLESLKEDGKEMIEVRELAAKFTTDVIGSTAYGLDVNSFKDPNAEFRKYEFDGDDLMAQAASFFSAGFETSSTTTAFALYELALQPDIQSTLRKEIVEALDKSDGKITYDMTTSLPYLDMVVSETLRMYPPLGYLNRMPSETYKVPNFDLVIEKDTPIYIPMLGLHYDPEYFPNPNKFDPERFNEENKRDRPACVYFPFGEGPRACIGTRLGILQIKLALIIILRKCEITPCKETLIPMIIDPKGAMTVPLNGVIYLNFQKIKSSAL
ncbi:hypothetical protein ACFW04_012069 [Cataglyphis niger]